MRQWDNERWEWIEVPKALAGAGACEVHPRMRKTGVLRTRDQGFALQDNLVLDWLELTIPVQTPQEQTKILAMLGETLPLRGTPYGGNGYIAGASFLDGGRVLWHPDRSEMGVHVRVPARCLAALAELLEGWSDPVLVLKNLVGAYHATVTRLDLAIDLETDIVHKAVEAVRAGAYTSRARSWRIVENNRGGVTVYVGARASNTYVRIYDKADQRGLEGVAWSRTEFEYKGDNANAVAGLVLAGDFAGIRSLMYGHLDFKDASATDSNKRRWPSAAWWLDILNAVVKRSLALPARAAATIERVGEYLEKQAGPSLALWWVYLEKQGGDVGAWVMSHAARWGPKHRLILDTF